MSAKRPLLVDVCYWREGRPVMRLAWPGAGGAPTRWLDVKILRPDATKRWSWVRASEEIAAWTPEQLELLYECSKPGGRIRRDGGVAVSIDVRSPEV